MLINWNSFITNNQDARGVRFKFEDLCRLLFVNENISGNKQSRYLHANPNNPGLETEPVFDEKEKQWIGFQAKFFDNDVDYSQIKHSAEQTVKYYTGKEGIVNRVYFFCNKPISVTSKGYLDTVGLLKSNGIELQLITDNAILDLVINKYPYLGLYYFGSWSPDQKWFVSNSNYMFDELGERFNNRFNVETDASRELSLFLHNQQAADILNLKKRTLLDEIEKLYTACPADREYLSELSNAVSKLPDANTQTLFEAFEWINKVMAEINFFSSKLIEEKEDLLKKLDELSAFSQNQKIEKSERDRAIKDYNSLYSVLKEKEKLIRLPETISISDREIKLLCSSVMILSGRAGTGKSQLLANKTNSLLDQNRPVLLLVAGIYYSELPIQEQIVSNLRLDCSFDDLIDVLETVGERNNCIVPVFIDALNETWNNRLWKTSLPAIIEKIEHSPMVKLVVSYRPEYENILLSDSIQDKKKKESIVTVHHRGFEENSNTAVKEFLNHYNIPFTLFEYFGAEMTNPLFLTLYCKTYNGDEVSLPKLYERLIEKAEYSIYTTLDLRSKGYSEGDDILKPLISQIASRMVINEHRAITKAELMQLRYWNDYGLVAAPLINSLVKEGMFLCYADHDIEYYFFAYDQMNDYYCAKAILDTYSKKLDLRRYISEKILKIENGELNNYSDIDLFVHVCALYADKYGEECIDIIDSIKEAYNQWEVFSRYLCSFQWRDPAHISRQMFIELLKKYPCKKEDLWPVLIGNSVKIGHPLNADFLHEFLSGYRINKRDSLWTQYINDLHPEDRIIQLVQMYDRGERLDYSSEKQIELLLTLFGWLLTSSNRWLRDYASKAMIEILKEHFQLCIPMLKKFKDVDDPYVIQRLFGVTFGACCKRNEGNLKELAEYVYEAVFKREKVYPDILLRDYARLIIEKFLSENPTYNGTIIHDAIFPPYNSDPIPEIEDQHYLEKEYNGGMFWLLNSMRFEGMGMYGDFGRYVFQSALHNFAIDDKTAFNYAMYFILNELGYNEEYFGEYDQHCGGYSRHQTIKTERIGKKYQWITMYNMLARISDNCKMIERWGKDSEEICFKGAWDLYVRDFDPTLNRSFMTCPSAPRFAALDNHIARGVIENRATDISDKETQDAWLETKGVFLEDLRETLILIDESGQQWVCLTKYCDTGREDLNTEKLLVWSWLYAYFMTPEQADAFSKYAEKRSIFTGEIASYHETYSVFNREYPWSPSCQEVKEYGWVDAQIKTGEKETITETVQIPDSAQIEAILQKYLRILDNEVDISEIDPAIQSIKDKEENDAEDSDIPEIQFKEVTRQREVEKEIGKILHATTDLVWEGIYDATNEEPISYSLPCASIIEEMGLSQKEADGFFCDSAGKLAAFDTDLTQKINSVVVRKDVLDGFLKKNGMKLVWLVQAEKEIHKEDRSITRWSEWEAVFTYERDDIKGNIHMLE